MFEQDLNANQIKFKALMEKEFPETARCLLDWKNERMANKLLGKNSRINYRMGVDVSDLKGNYIVLNPIVIHGKNLFVENTQDFSYRGQIIDIVRREYTHKSPAINGSVQIKISKKRGINTVGIAAVESFEAATQSYRPMAWLKKEWMDRTINRGKVTTYSWNATHLTDLQTSQAIDYAMDSLIGGLSIPEVFLQLSKTIVGRVERTGEELLDSMDEPKISYTHKEALETRFQQYAKDRVPEWAVNIRPEPTDREEIVNRQKESVIEVNHNNKVEKGIHNILDEPEISYAHQSEPKGTRFKQYAKSMVPSWAVDIRPEPTAREEIAREDTAANKPGM